MPYLTPETLPATFICRRLRIPNDLGFIQAVNGALLELCQVYNWEQYGAVTPEQARAAMLDMLLDTLDGECPDETPEPGEKLVFKPDASLITYAPQDPFAASELVPPGYVHAPLYEIAEGVFPFPGVQVGDVLTDIAKLPTAWPPLLPPDGYPRFRVHFHVTGPGPGEVELHLVKLPQAGLALVTLDGDPGSADFIDLTTASVLDLTDLGALLGTVLDGDLVRTHIQELHVAEVGDHFIDVTFLPKITSDTLLGFGGGLRQVVLGGTAEAGNMPAPQFRLTGTVLEWRPTDAHVWIELGDLGAEVGAAIESTEVIAVGWQDSPSLVYDAEDKKLTLTLPVGHPPVNDIQATQLTVAADGGTPSSLLYNAEQKRLELTLGKYFSQLVRTGASEISFWGDGGYASRQSFELRDLMTALGWTIDNGYLSIWNPAGGNISLTPLNWLVDHMYSNIYGPVGTLFVGVKGQASEWQITMPWHLNFTQSQPSQEGDWMYPNTLQLDKNAEGNYLRLTYPLEMIARIRQFSEVPGRIQYQTVNSDQWQSLVDVPMPAFQTPVEPVPGAVDETDAVCLAAMNAARAIGATYQDIASKVAASPFTNPLGFAQWIGETALGVLSGSSLQSILQSVELTIKFLDVQGDITALLWGVSHEDTLKCILIDGATVSTSLEVGFDYNYVLSQVQSMAGGLLNRNQWDFVEIILKWMNADMLATAGKLAYYTVPDCSSC